MDSNRSVVYLVFGALLGMSMGFADGIVGLHVWLMLGRPDFFIRPNWGEIPHIVLLTFSGAIAGVLYGCCLMAISHRRAGGFRLGYLYSSSIGAAIPIFFCAHYYIIKNRVPLTKVPFIPELSVFLLSILLALLLRRESVKADAMLTPA